MTTYIIGHFPMNLSAYDLALYFFPKYELNALSLLMRSPPTAWQWSSHTYNYYTLTLEFWFCQTAWKIPINSLRLTSNQVELPLFPHPWCDSAFVALWYLSEPSTKFESIVCLVIINWHQINSLHQRILTFVFTYGYFPSCMSVKTLFMKP